MWLGWTCAYEHQPGLMRRDFDTAPRDCIRNTAVNPAPPGGGPELLGMFPRLPMPLLYEGRAGAPGTSREHGSSIVWCFNPRVSATGGRV